MMVGKLVVLLSCVTLNPSIALSFTKAGEPGNAVRIGLPSFEGLCIFGVCISNKKNYETSVKEHDASAKTMADLTKKAEELDQWKQDDLERQKFEEAERKNMEEWNKNQADWDQAGQCACGFGCAKNGDGSICYRTCCKGEFGGDPAKQAHGNPMLEKYGSKSMFR
eukprot:gnl/MRDRNA2_/MRDRNA2_48269_c0_seq1.p1 gnl/MRDRNA2_/MRDRNA2_48269_c0~~gnl/MRDRNA2_/MRDRNA2_48269_c0_seq1.p1  ORF type:complete len:166 (-),score=39.67 gnl/MRDRNA2_/MRDRNA2_48269_c0_seq1:15-512(-)